MSIVYLFFSFTIFLIFKGTFSSLIQVKFILMWGRNLMFPPTSLGVPITAALPRYLSRSITIFILTDFQLLLSFIDLWVASGTGTTLCPLYLGATFQYPVKRAPALLLSCSTSFLTVLLYSSRWTLESFFKVSTKILLGFSLELHLIYRSVWGRGLASLQFWDLCENETRFSNCSRLCLKCPSVCVSEMDFVRFL